MYSVWGSTSFQVPSQMLSYTKSGEPKVRNTLTKRGNISTYNKKKAIRLTTSTGHTNILDEAVRLNLNNLQKSLLEEQKLFKERKKIISR